MINLSNLSIHVYNGIPSIYKHIYLQTQKDVDIYTIKLHRVILHVYAYMIILVKKRSALKI